MLQYLVRQPKIKTEKPPLLILLHGIGSNEKDLFSFANKIPDRFLVISARAPHALGNNGFAWYEATFGPGKTTINKEQAAESRNTIIQFIGDLKKGHYFDTNQVYLCGFSQGAIMSYSVGLTRPDLIRGMALMSGRLLDEVKPLIDSTKDFKQLKVFMSHGINDNVLKVEYAREGQAFLNALHIVPTYKEYNEGHGINNEMLNDLIHWLE